MKNKAQTGLGPILVAFIAVIVALTLFIAIAQGIGAVTDTSTYNTTSGNDGYTCPADTVIIDLEGQELLSVPVVLNGSALATPDPNNTIGAGNYTIDEGISATTGVKTIQYTAIGSEFDGETLNISYDFGADGYIDNSGARSVTILITIFAALAIGIIALVPAIRSGILDLAS